MKLRKILLGDHYTNYWKGPILPDPYPPDHPRAPCYKCNQLCEELVNWLEKLCRWMLFPMRRHRTRYLIFTGLLLFVMMLLNTTQYPMTLETHTIHSPRPDNSWKTFVVNLFGSSAQNHKPVKKPLIHDWVFAPNCEALLRGDGEEIHFTKRMLYREVRDKVTDTEYLLQTKSCAQFRATEGYPTHALSADEEGFPMAYVIQGYKHVEQLHRLLKAVYAPQNPYCICTNHKATNNFDESIKSISNCFQNVFHVSTLRFNRTKGPELSEVDDIKCARKCMKILLNSNWKYLIKIHGQDYPLVTNQFIVSKLKSMERINANFISDYGHMQKKQTIKVPLSNSSHDEADVTLWRASPFFVVSKGVVERVMENSLTYKLLPFIQQHEHPESYFWVSLILHIIGDSNHAAMVAANKHRIELQAHRDFHTKLYCAGITQLQDHCILGVEDLTKLFHQRQNQFFAHAFDLDRDHVVYGCLEQRLDDLLLTAGANVSESFNDPKVHASQPEIHVKPVAHEHKNSSDPGYDDAVSNANDIKDADTKKIVHLKVKEVTSEQPLKEPMDQTAGPRTTKDLKLPFENEGDDTAVKHKLKLKEDENTQLVPTRPAKNSDLSDVQLHPGNDDNADKKIKKKGVNLDDEVIPPASNEEPLDLKVNVRQKRETDVQLVEDPLVQEATGNDPDVKSAKTTKDDTADMRDQPDKQAVEHNVINWLEERQKTNHRSVKEEDKNEAAQKQHDVSDTKGAKEGHTENDETLNVPKHPDNGNS